MPRKTTFGDDSSDDEGSAPVQQTVEAPRTAAQPAAQAALATIAPTATGSSTPKKRATLVNGHGAGGGSANKKPRLVGFTESDEEDAARDKDSLLHLANVEGQTNGTANRKRLLLTNEQKKKLKDEVKRLLPGRKELPVWEGKEEILKQVQANDTVVVLGETGSGKTTQIPQFLMRSSVPCEAPRVVCTQPRRVAATSLASRVSAEVGCPLGTLVGYTVRFDDRSTNKTRLKYATDGALLAEMLGDKDLDNYDVVILDEAHERSLRTDMLMGFLKDIQARRKEKVKEYKNGKGKAKVATGRDATNGGTAQTNGIEREPTELKIVVMSATIDAKRFSDFFDNAPVLFVKGRQHKVTLHYTTEPQNDFIDSALKTVFQIHTKFPPGAILVFLPGQDEIESLAASIKQFLPDLPKSFPNADAVLVTPLYAKLPAAEQALAFVPSPPNTRKIILATNVAETSVTLPGVKYVVDCGVAKEKRYHADVGIDSLTIEGISQSSAKQRAGRAGRESDGHCFRLYTEPDFLSMPKRTEPEIKRVSLTFALLHLLAAGQEDVSKFHYMDKPDRDALLFAMLTLHGLGATDNKGRITRLGLQMAQLPLDPVYARVLIASFAEGCPDEAINLVALLGSKEQILAVSSANRDAANEARRKFVHRSGDHLTLINILQAFEELESDDEQAGGGGGVKKQQNERKQWCRENFISYKAMLQVLDARKQLRERCERLKIGDWRVSCLQQGDGEYEPILNALVGGLFSNTAIRNEDGTYRHAMTRQLIAIHPSSSMHNRKAPAIVYDELVLTTKTYARGVSEIDPRSIRTKAPAVFNSGKQERSGAGRDGSTTRDAARTGSHQIEASLPSTTTRAPNVSIPHEHTSASALDSAKVNEEPAKASDRASTSQERDTSHSLDKLPRATSRDEISSSVASFPQPQSVAVVRSPLRPSSIVNTEKSCFSLLPTRASTSHYKSIYRARTTSAPARTLVPAPSARPDRGTRVEPTVFSLFRDDERSVESESGPSVNRRQRADPPGSGQRARGGGRGRRARGRKRSVGSRAVEKLDIPFLRSPSPDSEERTTSSADTPKSPRAKRPRPRDEAEHVGDQAWQAWSIVGMGTRVDYDTIQAMSGRGALKKWGWWKPSDPGEDARASRTGNVGIQTGAANAALGTIANIEENLSIQAGGQGAEKCLHMPDGNLNGSSSRTVESETAVEGDGIPSSQASLPGARKRKRKIHHDLGSRSSVRLALKQSNVDDENEDGHESKRRHLSPNFDKGSISGISGSSTRRRLRIQHRATASPGIATVGTGQRARHPRLRPLPDTSETTGEIHHRKASERLAVAEEDALSALLSLKGSP